MVLEIALDFNCLPGLAEFKVFSEEHLVQEYLWKYQSRIFLTVNFSCLKLCYSTNHCEQSLTRAMVESFLLFD